MDDEADSNKSPIDVLTHADQNESRSPNISSSLENIVHPKDTETLIDRQSSDLKSVDLVLTPSEANDKSNEELADSNRNASPSEDEREFSSKSQSDTDLSTKDDLQDDHSVKSELQIQETQSSQAAETTHDSENVEQIRCDQEDNEIGADNFSNAEHEVNPENQCPQPVDQEAHSFSEVNQPYKEREQERIENDRSKRLSISESIATTSESSCHIKHKVNGSLSHSKSPVTVCSVSIQQEHDNILHEDTVMNQSDENREKVVPAIIQDPFRSSKSETTECDSKQSSEVSQKDVLPITLVENDKLSQCNTKHVSHNKSDFMDVETEGSVLEMKEKFDENAISLHDASNEQAKRRLDRTQYDCTSNLAVPLKKESEGDHSVQRKHCTEQSENAQINGNATHNEYNDSDDEPVDHQPSDSQPIPLKRTRSLSPINNEDDTHEPCIKQPKLRDSFENDKFAINESTTQENDLLRVNTKLDQSADSGKSSLGDSNDPSEQTFTQGHAEKELNEVNQEQCIPQTSKATRIEDDDLDDKSSSSSSASSSSSSSESDSSDDEPKKELSPEINKDEGKQINQDRGQQLSDEKHNSLQRDNEYTTDNAKYNQEDSKSGLEIDSLSPSSVEAEDDADEGGSGGKDAKITKSEGLKLSISLKRPISEDKSSNQTAQLPPVILPTQPQPVDFTNFLNPEKLFGDRSELIKIDYNKSEIHNISDQVSQMESEIKSIEPNPSGNFNLLYNQLKTNYVGVNTDDFLMDESSDTLDEENRLVIAEKQRRGRKKDNSPTKQANQSQQLQLQQQQLQQHQQLVQQHPIHLQQTQIQPWQQAIDINMPPGAARNSTVPIKTAQKRPQQRQQSLMKIMLANSKIHQDQLPVPPMLSSPVQQPLQQSQPDPSALPLQQALQPEKKKDKKKVFLCSPCGTHYENWNLFRHMREVHRKYICLYCLGIFQSAERLVSHLEVKHQVRKKHVSSIDEYQNQQQPQQLNTESNRTLYLMCVRCEHVFENSTPSDNEIILQHDCTNYMEKCDNCGNFKQSKHKCDKKNDLLSGNNAVNSNTKSNSNNNYERSSNNVNSSAVMYSLDNRTLSSNGAHDNVYQMNTVLDSAQTIAPPRKDKKEKTQPRSLTSSDLTNPININTQLLLNLPPGQLDSDHQLAFGSPILQSQLLKPMESMSQISMSVPYPTELLQQQPSFYASTQQPSYLVNLPSQLIDTGIKHDFNQSTTTLSTIPASLLNDMTALELPPVPELPQASPNRNQQSGSKTQQQLLVPKLKVKIPKKFCTQPIESEQSSTESDDEEPDDDDLNEDDENKHPKQNVKIHSELQPEDTEQTNIEGSSLMQSDTRMEEDIKLDPVEMDIEEEGDRQPVNLPPEMGPAPAPISEQRSLSSDRTPSLLTGNTAEENSQVKKDDASFLPATRESIVPEDGIVIASEDSQLFELTLDVPLDKIHIREFIKICLLSTVPFCLYCNHARRIAVNGKYLALHLVSTHRFQATVNSITAEELLPATIVQRFKTSLEELESLFFNLETFDSSWSAEEKAVTYPKQFECFQCRFITTIHKELYLHNRKMHQKSALICLMCRSNFFSYSELLCHMCPGAPNQIAILDYTFRCCLCNIDGIPSAFRLMVHLRKRHFACDVCLEQCIEQGALSNHVWKHKLHHLCYRCGIAYRNKADILKHLFWKHGTEGVVCKRCLQKKWPHVYHFCVPPAQFICDVCQMGFRKSIALKVHQRLHNGEEKYPCTEDSCEKKFISKKLLLKHVQRHYEPIPPAPSPPKTEELAQAPLVETIATIKEEEQKPKVESVVKEEVDEHCSIKAESKQGDKKDEISKPIEHAGDTTRKKKKKRSKDDQEKSLVDIMNLPAVNLSESDSSDDSDTIEHFNTSSIGRKSLSEIQQDKSGKSDDELDKKTVDKDALKTERDEVKNIGSEQIVNIWNNFKNYQASRDNSRRQSLTDETNEEQVIEKQLKNKVLHVVESDHDYCRMYKLVYLQTTSASPKDVIVIDDNSDIGSKPESSAKNSAHQPSSSKKQKSPRKRKHSKSGGSESSSSESGSGSDSSCECGSNCSCSSSSSGSSSSSSDDSESSNENGTKKKESKENKSKKVEQIKLEEDVTAVPEVPIEPTEPVDPDSIIHESDLETDESETDEEFYDNHPQKLANELLAEKRRQLLQQTCMSPLNSFGIVENSRPSTPSLPEEMVSKKKVKVKKRRRERKITKKPSTPQDKQEVNSSVNIPAPLNLNPLDQFTCAPPLTPALPKATPPNVHSVNTPVNYPGNLIHDNQSTLSTPLAAPRSSSKIATPRLSTGNSSESDVPLKRSQRSRKPNKFYGYTSDDEISPTLTPTSSKAPEKSILSVMKPTPPPNLIWRKDDLPSPSNLKPKVLKSKQPETLSNTPLTSARTSFITTPVQQPPKVDNTRIPHAPVHHINPSPLNIPAHIAEVDSDSSQEGVLLISHPTKTPSIRTTPHRPQPPLPKLKLSLSKKSGGRNTPKTPSGRKRGSKSKAPPKSAPPLLPTAASAMLHKDLTPTSAPPFQPPIVESAPKVPPLGSFPSIHTEFFPPNQIRIPAGWRPPREGESVYCYCRCPYDEVSEMIACDGDNCRIEWFHFECVGIIMPPKGKWFCPECKTKQTQLQMNASVSGRMLQDSSLDSN